MTDLALKENNLNNKKQAVDLRVSYLGAHELKLTASLLYQAYHDDPIFLDIFNSTKEGYELRLRGAIREEVHAFWQSKQPMLGLYKGEVMVGVACLNSPSDRLATDQFWHWRLKMLLNAGYFSIKKMMQKEQTVLTTIPLKKYHFLSFIAVHPLHQQHGLGNYLMAAINKVLDEHKDSEGVAVYATSAKFKEFFNHADYELIEEVSVGNVHGAVMVHYRNQR